MHRMIAILIGVLGLAPAEAAPAEFTALEQEHRQLVQAVEGWNPPTPYIVINTQDNQLLLRDGSRVVRQAVCATGSGRKLEGDKRWHRWTFDTPKGRFAVRRKVADPIWIRPTWDFIENAEQIPIFAEDRRRFQYGVLGEYALYFLQDFMIHGTLFEVNLGKSITHGCVRLGGEDLRYFYQTVQVGWPVYIY
jgi:L,D-transpeptidase YbiS